MHKHSRLHSKVPLPIEPSLQPLLGFGDRCLGGSEFWALHWMAGEHEHKTVWFKLGAHSFPLNMLAGTKSKLRKVLWSWKCEQALCGWANLGQALGLCDLLDCTCSVTTMVAEMEKSHLGSNYSKNAVLGPVLCSGFFLQIPTDTLPGHTDRQSTQTLWGPG